MIHVPARSLCAPVRAPRKGAAAHPATVGAQAVQKRLRPRLRELRDALYQPLQHLFSDDGAAGEEYERRLLQAPRHGGDAPFWQAAEPPTLGLQAPSRPRTAAFSWAPEQSCGRSGAIVPPCSPSECRLRFSFAAYWPNQAWERHMPFSKGCQHALRAVPEGLADAVAVAVAGCTEVEAEREAQGG